MAGVLWVRQAAPPPVRYMRASSFGVRPDGSIVGPGGRGFVSFEDTVMSLGWDIQMGGGRLHGISYDTEIHTYEGLGKRRLSLKKKIMKRLSPKAVVKQLSPKGMVKTMKSAGHAITHPKETFKKHWRTMSQIRRTIEPKFVRKVFSKKNFVKYAPIIAAVAQILNFIPGLGVLVGIAIMAGAAAITVGAKLVQLHDVKKAAAKQKEAEKVAEVKAVAAYDQSAGYFEEKYGVTEQQFKAMPFEEKMNFLQVAAEDAKAEETPEGKAKAALQSAAPVGMGIGAVGLLALLFL